MLVIAALGPAVGRAWHFCCTVRFVPESGGAEPAGSGHPAAAPYSSAWRNRLLPHLVCQQPKLPNANLQGDNKQRCVNKGCAATQHSEIGMSMRQKGPRLLPACPCPFGLNPATAI